MTGSGDTDLDQLADQVLAQGSQRRAALQRLLEEELHRTDRLLAQRSQMGDSEAYVTSVTLSWLRANVQFAHNLPLFKEKYNPKTGRIEIDATTMKKITQRPINYSRQFPMAQYLLRIRNHKFPPILAVLNCDWVDNPEAEEWTALRAVRSVAEFEPLSSSGDVGLLRVGTGFTLYALDGQHRLLAVDGALEFIEKDILYQMKDDRKQTGTSLTKETLAKQNPDITESYLQSLKNERIGLEILPAVMQGESREESRIRVRTIFVHVNRYATVLEKGMMTVLDEDNGFRLVAKEIATKHLLFEGETRVEMQKPNLTSKSKQLTTLETLANGLKLYCEHTDPYDDWLPDLKGLVPQRPDEEQLAACLEEATDVFDRLAKIPIMQKVLQGESTAELREFGKGGARSHLLMRPIGQQALLEAIGYCHYERGLSLDDLFTKIARLDRDGRFDNIDDPASLWWGLQVKHGPPPAIKNQRRGSTVDMLKYLLGGLHGEGEEIEALKAAAINDRTTAPPDEKIIGFNGKPTTAEAFSLPNPL